MNNMKFGFWLNASLAALNLFFFFANGSLFSLAMAGFSGYVAYRLKGYAGF